MEFKTTQTLNIEVVDWHYVKGLIDQLGVEQEGFFAFLQYQYEMGEGHKPVHLFQHDASSAKDGVVKAPEFYWGAWDDGSEDNQVTEKAIQWYVTSGEYKVQPVTKEQHYQNPNER